MDEESDKNPQEFNTNCPICGGSEVCQMCKGCRICGTCRCPAKQTVESCPSCGQELCKNCGGCKDCGTCTCGSR